MDRPDAWETGTVRGDGVELQYYRAGSGPPLVLAHGFYVNGRCWAPLLGDLAADFEVVAYDARGHGLSEAPESGYGIDERVADLVGVVRGLDLTDPVLLGHSMGAVTVAWAAATHPDLPRAVVLEDPVGMRDAAEPGMAVANTECRPEIAEIAREGTPPLPEALAEISCPALVLKSDAEPETRAAELAVADAIERGRLVHVPDAGHYVVYDRHDAATAELRTFFRRTGVIDDGHGVIGGGGTDDED